LARLLLTIRTGGLRKRCSFLLFNEESDYEHNELLHGKERKMNSAIERLLSLKACDVMSVGLITISSNSTMEEAASLLNKHHVTGAPVVDEFGNCVGVLSASDFVREKADALGDFPPSHVLSKRPVSGAYFCEEVLQDIVNKHMSPAVQSINMNSTLLEAARCMCHEHIHRLIVVDGGLPVGIVSSLDVVAALVKAVEE
jgi:CBS-domain-containing membrane protein